MYKLRFLFSSALYLYIYKCSKYCPLGRTMCSIKLALLPSRKDKLATELNVCQICCLVCVQSASLLLLLSSWDAVISKYWWQREWWWSSRFLCGWSFSSVSIFFPKWSQSSFMLVQSGKYMVLLYSNYLEVVSLYLLQWFMGEFCSQSVLFCFTDLHERHGNFWWWH